MATLVGARISTAAAGSIVSMMRLLPDPRVVMVTTHSATRRPAGEAPGSVSRRTNEPSHDS